MNHSQQYEDDRNETIENDFDELAEFRDKIRGMDAVKFSVRQAITQWLRSPYAPKPIYNEQIGSDIYTIELGFRSVDRVIKRFFIEWPNGEIAKVASDIVETAALELANSTEEKCSYIIRLYGGNDSKTFPLSIDRGDDSEEEFDEHSDRRTSRELAPPTRGGIVSEQMMELYGNTPQQLAQNAFGLQLNHNAALTGQIAQLMEQNRLMAETVISTRSKESKIMNSLIEDQQKTINRMMKERFDSLDIIEENLTRKHDREAAAREDERKASRDEKILEFGMNFILPTLLDRFGINIRPIIAQANQAGESSSPAEGTPYRQDQSPIEATVERFLKTISVEQFESFKNDGIIRFNNAQKMGLIELMTAISQAENFNGPIEAKVEQFVKTISPDQFESFKRDGSIQFNDAQKMFLVELKTTVS